MSIVDACSSWLDTLVLIAWYFLQSREGGQAIASIGGLLVVLYYLRTGALPGGRALAVMLSVLLAVGLWSLVVLAATSWQMDHSQKCNASPILQSLVLQSLANGQ